MKSIEIRRTVLTTTALPKVFEFLADFTNTNTWDPGTVHTYLIDGDGGVGTRYANVSRFAGRDVHLTYTVDHYQHEHQIKLRAKNATTTAVDTMTFATTPAGGTRVIYHAKFTFSGLLALVMPLLTPSFQRLGNRAEHGMQKALDALEV